MLCFLSVLPCWIFLLENLSKVVKERHLSEHTSETRYLGHNSSDSRSVMSDSLRPHRLQAPRLLCPWDSPGKDTGGVAMPSSKGSSQPRDRTQVSCIAGIFFTSWATRDPGHTLILPATLPIWNFAEGIIQNYYCLDQYGPNRSRFKKRWQEYTEEILTTQITTMVWSLT